MRNVFESGRRCIAGVSLLAIVVGALFSCRPQVRGLADGDSEAVRGEPQSSDQLVQSLAERMMSAAQELGVAMPTMVGGFAVRREGLERHLAGLADRDGSGEVSLDEATWLSRTINGALAAEAAAAEVGSDLAALSLSMALSERELAEILDDFCQIEGRLRLQCDGYVPVSLREFGLHSIAEFPSGWLHYEEQGIDSEIGCFVSEELGLVIIYDIGDAASEFVRVCGIFGPDWIRTGRFGGKLFRYSRSEEFFLVTIPGEGPANYVAKVRSREESDYVLELVVRYRAELHLLESSRGDPQEKSPCEP